MGFLPLRKVAVTRMKTTHAARASLIALFLRISQDTISVKIFENLSQNVVVH